MSRFCSGSCLGLRINPGTAGRGLHPYLVPNPDEMEPGTFKDRVLVNVNPYLVLEGIILAANAIAAARGVFFVRPSCEMDAWLIEKELLVAREAGFLGTNILGSGFSFDLVVHRSAGLQYHRERPLPGSGASGGALP